MYQWIWSEHLRRNSEMRLWSLQTETQKDRSNQRRWKRLFQRFLKTRFPMKASLIAFQLSWDCLEHIMDRWYDQKELYNDQHWRGYYGSRNYPLQKPRGGGAAIWSLLIIDNLKPKEPPPTAADGIAAFQFIVIFVIVIFLPTLVTSVAPEQLRSTRWLSETNQANR